MISSADWSSYKQKFLDASGRIVDDANGNISHSEGQGYGLLLAYLAENRADFDLIWSFTRTELLLRDDRLSAWRWDPAAIPHVTDINNATDGDILIAYALARAGRDWNIPELSAFATLMIKAIAAQTLRQVGERTVIMPGATGFGRSDRDDGPVVNPSYWVFEAFPLFAELDPETDWASVEKDGLDIIGGSMIGPERLPPNWLSLRTSPKPAEGFSPDFGYDALRVPLYLVRAGFTEPDLLEPFAAMENGVPVTDLSSGAVRETLTDKGYLLIPALARCVLRKTAVPDELKKFEPSLYFPSTLQLLGLSWLAEHKEACG
ncbi:MAG: glycosyl hydrolase family 8 [Rhizobiaceae bacterium]|nr:glycosyl hydrolase family 8 [Rhizobiaceae bacterium]